MSGLVSNLSSNAISKFERKISGKGDVRAGKRFILFISNEDMNDVIKIIKSLEDWDVLIDGFSEQFAPLAVSLVQPLTSSVVKGGGRRAGRGYTNKKF